MYLFPYSHRLDCTVPMVFHFFFNYSTNISCQNIKQICKSTLRMAIDLETFNIDLGSYFHILIGLIVLCPWSFLFFFNHSTFIRIHKGGEENFFWYFLFLKLLNINLNTLWRGKETRKNGLSFFSTTQHSFEYTKEGKKTRHKLNF